MKSWIEKKISKYVQHIMNENLFLMKYLLEPQRTKQSLQAQEFNDKKCVYW